VAPWRVIVNLRMKPGACGLARTAALSLAAYSCGAPTWIRWCLPRPNVPGEGSSNPKPTARIALRVQIALTTFLSVNLNMSPYLSHTS